MLAGVVLAAGSGSRFGPGAPKVLAPLAGLPLVEHVLRALRAAAVGQIVLVVGYGADQVVAGCDVSGVTVVPNPHHADGQATSLRAGLEAVAPAAEAAVVALGDQPGLTPRVVAALADAYRRELRPIAVPVYGGRRGNPVLLARPIFPSLMALRGDTGARQVMEDHPRWVTEVPADGLADPRDVDTPDDLRALSGSGPAAEPGRAPSPTGQPGGTR